MKLKKSLKIAFFVTEFPSISETFVINQIIGLQQKGHLVHVFSKGRPSGKIMHQTVIDAGLLNHTFYFDELPHSRFLKIVKLFRKCLFNILNKNIPALFKAVFYNNSKLSVYNFISFVDKPEYDIIHAHFGVNGNYVTQLRKLGLYKKTKFITTFHGYDLNELHYRGGFYKALFEECDSFTTNSFHSKKRLLKLGCDEQKISVLPVGLNISLFQRNGNAEIKYEKIRLLFVGRLIKLKGPHLFVEICKRLIERNEEKFHATIIGDGVMMVELSRLINENGLLDIISIKGALTQDKVIEIMEHSNIFVLPGIIVEGVAETQGLVIQEAQAMQLPVIVSDSGGMKEGMIDEVTGFVVPEGDINGFVEKIELLASDFALRKRMGEAGRKFVEENFDINILNERLMKIYLN